MKIEVTRETPVVPPIESVVVTLTFEEAQNLVSMLGPLPPGPGSIGLMIYGRLTDAGVPYRR